MEAIQSNIEPHSEYNIINQDCDLIIMINMIKVIMLKR